MNLTVEQLEVVTRMAAVAFYPRQIAFALGLNVDEFTVEVNNEQSSICDAYYKGFYSSQLAVRENIFLLARNGSSPAQQVAYKLITDTRNNLIENGANEEI